MGEVDRRLRGLRRAVAQAERGGDAEAGRADRGKPASASAAADAWSHAFGSTSGSPGRCRSLNALIGRGPLRRARGRAPRRDSDAGRRRTAGRSRSTRTVSPSASDTTGDGHRQIIPPNEPGRRLAGLDEDLDPRGDDVGRFAGEEVEEGRERRVGAGRVGVRVVGGRDEAGGGDRVGEVGRGDAERLREHGDRHVRRVVLAPRRRGARAPRAAPPGRGRRGAPRPVRGGGCGSRRWRSGRRSRAARPSSRTGRAGRGRARERRAAWPRRYARDVSAPAETSRA